MALTKVIEKGNTIEEIKEDLEKLMKRHEEVLEEKENINF